MASREIKVNVGGKQDTKHVHEAGRVVATFADGTIGHFRRISSAVFNLRNMLVGGLFGATLNKLTQDGDQVDKLSQRIAITAREFQVLRHALELGGSSAGAAETMFRTMNMRLFQLTNGSTEGADSLRELGLTVDELRGLSPWELFEKIAQGVARIDDKARRGAVAQEMFGRSGMALIPVLNSTGGNLDELAKKMERNGQLLSDEQIKKSADFRDALTDLNRAIQASLFDVLEQQIGDISAAIEKLVNSGKITEWGDEAVDRIAKLYRQLTVLAGFLVEHRDTLRMLGISYITFRTLQSAILAVEALRVKMVALQAQAIATGGAMSTLNAGAAGIGGGVVVAGVSLLIGLMNELRRAANDAAEEVDRLRSDGGSATGSYTEGGWKYMARSILAANLPLMTYGMISEEDVWGKDRIESSPGKITDADRAASRKRLEDKGRLAQAEADAAAALAQLASDQEIAARAAAAAQVQSEIEREQDRRRQIVETENEIARLEQDAAEANAKRMAEIRLEALAEEEADHQDRLARLRAQGEDLRTAADDAADKAEKAFWRLLNPEAAAVKDSEAADEAKAMRKLDRQIASARRREAELMRGGYDQDEARSRMTKRGAELLAAEDLRQEAARAEKAAKDNATEQLAAQKALEDAQYQLRVATENQQHAAENQALAAAQNTEAVNKLRDQLTALRDSGGALAGMSEADLASAIAQAAAIVATDPATIARESLIAAVRDAVFGPGTVASGTPAQAPAVPGIPQAPANPQSPVSFAWQADLAAMRKSLERIEQDGGLN